jgi:hypothetical protein
VYWQQYHRLKVHTLLVVAESNSGPPRKSREHINTSKHEDDSARKHHSLQLKSGLHCCCRHEDNM